MIAESRRSGAVSIFVPVICSRLKRPIHAICTPCIKIGAVILQLLAVRRWVNNTDPNGFLIGFFIGKAFGNQHAPGLPHYKGVDNMRFRERNWFQSYLGAS
jgi:hypothetical protein